MNEFSPSKKKLKQYVFLLKKKKLFHETYPLQKKKNKNKKKKILDHKNLCLPN